MTHYLSEGLVEGLTDQVTYSHDKRHPDNREDVWLLYGTENVAQIIQPVRNAHKDPRNHFAVTKKDLTETSVRVSHISQRLRLMGFCHTHEGKGNDRPSVDDIAEMKPDMLGVTIHSYRALLSFYDYQGIISQYRLHKGTLIDNESKELTSGTAITQYPFPA